MRNFILLFALLPVGAGAFDDAGIYTSLGAFGCSDYVAHYDEDRADRPSSDGHPVHDHGALRVLCGQSLLFWLVLLALHLGLRDLRGVRGVRRLRGCIVWRSGTSVV